jgi:hypothetical protein
MITSVHAARLAADRRHRTGLGALHAAITPAGDGEALLDGPGHVLDALREVAMPNITSARLMVPALSRPVHHAAP